MVKWYLIWILTVQDYSGNIKEIPFSLPMPTKAECMMEARAKLDQLELLLGKDYYVTHYYGVKVRVSGKNFNVEVGCESRNG